MQAHGQKGNVHGTKSIGMSGKRGKRGNDFTLAHWAKGGKRRLFPRLNFSSDETVFIPVNRHVTWETAFLQEFPLAIAYWIVW